MASEINPPLALQSVLAKYPDVFMEGLGTLKGVKAKIYVDQGAEPKYIKARSVPYALKTNVELELERLEREGIISPVEFSEWAAPIVPVAKPNGTVRICGDYKLTVNQATVLEPLHKLLRQGTKWCWKTEQQMAFDKSKKLLQSANLLVHFQPDLELILASDASDYGVGAVLSHRMADGAERPIVYVSRSLNKAERGYSTIEKEALAIIFGVKKFNQFLYGQKFTVQTDHKPLEGLFNEKKGVPQQASPRVQRWAPTLAAYEYKIAYKAGTTNANADALSRLPLSNMPESVPVPGETILLLEHLDHTPINSQHIREWTRRDPVLSKVHQFTLNGWPHHCQDVQLHPYLSRKAELTIEGGCVLWGNRVIVPPQGRAQVIAELHSESCDQ